MFRFAVVAYRDVRTDPAKNSEEVQFSILNFTNDVDEVSRFLGAIKVGGGSDAPEDIAGALLKVRWAAKVKAKLSSMCCECLYGCP